VKRAPSVQLMANVSIPVIVFPVIRCYRSVK
jgi:hypothetical protein